MSGSADRQTLLVVDDDSDILEMLGLMLSQAGYRVLSSDNDAQARLLIHKHRPRLLLLDWMLAGEDGLQLLRWLRLQSQHQQLAVLMLTARGQEADRITGLDNGADDYLSKPFSRRELLARIRALLRRTEKPEESYSNAMFQLFPDEQRAFCKGIELTLQPMLFRLLLALLERSGKACRRQSLIAYAGSHSAIDERTIDVQIRRLRKQLACCDCAHLITTVRGIGYRLDV